MTRRRGAHKVWCDSRANNAPAKSLFRKIGFRKIALIEKHWYGLDFILWERFV
jgi:ribosomal protein S18 acetylase RimI-like enzyme